MFKNISIRSRYLISFVIILMVVFLFSNGLFESYRWNNMNYVDVSTLERFTYAADSLAQLTKPLDNLVSFTRLDEVFTIDAITGKVTYSDGAIFALLENLKSKLMEGVEILFFERGSKYLYTESEKIPYYEYEARMQALYDLPMSRFYTHLCKETSYALVPITYNDGTSGAIARIVPFNTGDFTPPCSLVFLLPGKLITEELERYMGPVKGDFYTYDQRYTVLYAHRSGEAIPYSFLQLARRKGSGVQAVDSDHVLLSVSKADTGLHFLLCETKADFYASVQQPIREFAIKTVLLGLLLVLLFAWQILFNYMPIRRLASELTGHSRQKSDRDELMMIKTSYDKTNEELEKLSDQVSELSPLAVQHFLSRWVLGRIPNEEAFEKLSSYADIALPYASYIVLYFSCEGSTENNPGKSVLLPLLNRFHSENGVTLCGELVEESALFMIVNCNETAEKNAAHVIGDEVLSFLQHNGFISVRIGVGSSCQNPLKVPESFREAGAAVQMTRSEKTSIAFYGIEDTLPKNDAEPYTHSFPPMSVSLLVGSINRADSPMARHALSEIMVHIRKDTTSVVYFRFYSSNLLKLMLDEAERNHIQYPPSDLHFLIAAASPDEFEENIYQFVDKLCAQVATRQALSYTNMHDRLMTYILEHYKDFTMSIQSVSEAADVPCADITHIIKEEVGLNFVQYVSYLRMNEFKRLLIETDHTISELVNEIGYSDVSNFLRKFKNVEGMTAGQYREKFASRVNPSAET